MGASSKRASLGKGILWQGRWAMGKAYALTMIALMVAAVGYMFYGTVPIMLDLFATASPGERVQMIVGLSLCAVILVCRVTVAVISHLESRTRR